MTEAWEQVEIVQRIMREQAADKLRCQAANEHVHPVFAGILNSFTGGEMEAKAPNEDLKNAFLSKYFEWCDELDTTTPEQREKWQAAMIKAVKGLGY